MSKDNNAFDKAFDVLLTEAAIKADENIGRKLEEPEEEIVFSKEHERKMAKLFRNAQRKLLMKNVMKYSMRCACVFLAVIVVAFASIFSVSAWRVKFLNFVMEIGAPNTDYNFTDGQINSYSDDGINLGYIPEGFELTKYKHVHSLFLKFECDSKYFTVSVDDIEGQSNIDTEGAEIESLTINGYDAIYIANTKYTKINALVWTDNVYGYTIYGNIDKIQIVKIAENIKIDKK